MKRELNGHRIDLSDGFNNNDNVQSRKEDIVHLVLDTDVERASSANVVRTACCQYLGGPTDW